MSDSKGFPLYSQLRSRCPSSFRFAKPKARTFALLELSQWLDRACSDSVTTPPLLSDLHDFLWCKPAALLPREFERFSWVLSP